MRAEIARSTVELRISEAESAKMITLHNMQFLYYGCQMYWQLCCYINEVKALGNNLDTTYLRLRDCLRQRVDLLEMELCLPEHQHRRQEILQDNHVELDSGVMYIDGLKRDFQNLTAKVHDLEPFESRPTHDSEHLTMEQTSERNAQQVEVMRLTTNIYLLKNKAEDNELIILDLKAEIARNTVELRISEAESAKMITLKFSSHAYQNYERLCSYINEIKTLGNNLETTYLRLRDRLSQHETVDLSEMELRLPDLPQNSRQVPQNI